MRQELNAYVYRGALYCTPCAKAIGRPHDLTVHPLDAEARCLDSHDFAIGPYHAGGGEADSPQHCDTCGVFLGNPLTTDGLRELRDALAEVKRTHNPHYLPSPWAEYQMAYGPALRALDDDAEVGR